MQNKLVFNMGLKPVLKIEPPADRRAAQRETHRVRRAARARSEIAMYRNRRDAEMELGRYALVPQYYEAITLGLDTVLSPMEGE